MALQSGARLGPYEIVSLLGKGGMGEVYRARDPRLERDVAVKVLEPTGATDPERLRRFKQETLATATLSHPNILTIHDVGTSDEQPFLVSELLEGQTLRQQMAERPLSAAEAVALGLQLAHGMAAAHSVRIVHRDIKPENLFVTHDGTLKILDFGLAKLRPDPLSGPDAATVAASIPGQLLGTLAYMAPEQLRSQPVDERTDVFATGAVLYETVTGRSPFQRASVPESMAATLNDAPAPMGEDVPAPLQRLILRCLEKEPGERFQSATDLASALETALAEPQAGRTADTSSDIPSIAVLPLADMSPGGDQDYFCDGLSDELINRLARIADLRVAARSSSFQFRGAAADIRAVGQQLGVETIVEGSVRKAGERLRVNVQLVDVAGGYQRWSERYDRKLEDVFAIQDEIAESIARSLRGVLGQREREALRRPETSIESYEYFLRGRQLLTRHDRPSIEGARRMFERAIELDPEYAPAWAGLADVHACQYEWWGGSEESLAQADTASRKALELAPDLAEAHASRGFTHALRGRYENAAREYDEALRIDPRLYEALYFYGRAAFAEGKIELSSELFRRAGEVREEDFQSFVLLSQSLRMLGRDDEAREANREGVRRAEKVLELNPSDPRALSLGANALMDDDQPERALTWSDRAIELYPEDQGVLTNAACLKARLGLGDEAIAILEQVFAQGAGKRDWVENDPDYDSLRGDPRFQALLDKLN